MANRACPPQRLLGIGFALCEARMYLYRGPVMPAAERKEQECSSEPRGYWGFGDGGESPAYWRQVSCWRGRRRMPPYRCCLR
ncbi:hypothetical protein NSND_62646 [Nitrospira sp. ND1]|nr:hypothetical protein NSND_62646 [Nitrospira sp. ND1]